MASSNFFIEYEDEEGATPMLKLRCDSCKFAGRNIVACSYCLTCKGKLCQECLDSHKREEATAGHHLSTLRTEVNVNRPRENTKTTERCRKHNERFLEQYCYKHDAMCCQTCVSNKHRKCNLVSLPEAAAGVRGSKQHKKITGEVKEMLRKFRQTQKDREDEAVNVDSQAESVVKAVRKYREKINGILDVMEIAALKKNDDLASKMSNTTNDHIKRCQGVIPILEKTYRRLDAARRGTGEQDLFVALHNADRRLKKCQETLDEIEEESKTYSFEFVQDTSLMQMLKKIGQLGYIQVDNPPEDEFEPYDRHHLKPIKNAPRLHDSMDDAEFSKRRQHVEPLRTQPYKDPMIITARPLQQPTTSTPERPQRVQRLPQPTVTAVKQPHLDTPGRVIVDMEPPLSPVPPGSADNSRDSDRICSITGSAYLDDGRLILVDSKNRRLELFDENYRPIYQANLPFWPWDVASLPEQQVAVTCLGENSVRLLKVDKTKDIDVMMEIKTDRQCWGVAYQDPNIYVTCGLKDDAEVHVYSKFGQFVRNIRLKAGTLDWPSYLTVDAGSKRLYISDLYNGIICLGVEEHQVKAMYQYKIPNVQFYCGIAVDSLGQLYVCTQEPHGVYRVNVQEKWIKSMVEKGGVVAEPMSISYSQTLDTLLVTFYKSNEVKLFRASE